MLPDAPLNGSEAHRPYCQACRIRAPAATIAESPVAVGLMAAGALAGALLLRVDVALPVLAAAVVIALAAVALRFGR
jgi:hypothetical protein